MRSILWLRREAACPGRSEHTRKPSQAGSRLVRSQRFEVRLRHRAARSLRLHAAPARPGCSTARTPPTQAASVAAITTSPGRATSRRCASRALTGRPRRGAVRQGSVSYLASRGTHKNRKRSGTCVNLVSVSQRRPFWTLSYVRDSFSRSVERAGVSQNRPFWTLSLVKGRFLAAPTLSEIRPFWTLSP